MHKIKVITPPTAEPVTLREVKAQMRFDQDDDSPDEDLIPLIPAAREWCEGFQNRAYVLQTLEMALDKWPCEPVRLLRPPLREFGTASYTNISGSTTVLPSDIYVIDDYREPARWGISLNQSWPCVELSTVNGVKLRYEAGYPPVMGEIVTGEALGDGGAGETIFQTDVYPIEPGSVTVKFDGTPSLAYVLDYDTGELTATPGEGVEVTIDYTEATDHGGNVPQMIKRAIILLVNYWYENPGCDPPKAVESLLWMDRIVPA